MDSKSQSVFNDVEGQPPDVRSSCSTSDLLHLTFFTMQAIIGITEAFRASTNINKLNLGVGAYRTEDLKPYVLDVVKKAEKQIFEKFEKGEYNHEYLPIEGLDSFRKATVDLLLGDDHPAIKEGRVAVLQSLSGTGSLRIGSGFLARTMKDRTVYISDPTWGNHKNIIGDEGMEWKQYRYYDSKTIGLDFEGMKEDISDAPEGSVILLHGCAHNPTGIDPTPSQWEELAQICIERKHLPWFDVAYQASG